MLPMDAVLPLMLFIALLLMLALLGLTASGHFPREHRPPALVSGIGPVVLFSSIAVAIICLLAGLVSAWRLVPWYAAVIGGGLAILAAPLVLQQFPDRLIDGRASLLSFASASAVLALLLIWLSMNRVAT